MKIIAGLLIVGGVLLASSETLPVMALGALALFAGGGLLIVEQNRGRHA